MRIRVARPSWAYILVPLVPQRRPWGLAAGLTPLSALKHLRM